MITTKKYKDRFGIYLLKYAIYILIALNFSLNLNRVGKPYLDIKDYINGTADFPYQYRILMSPVFYILNNLLSHEIFIHITSNIPGYISSPEQNSYFIVNFLGFFAAIIHFGIISKFVFRNNNIYTNISIIIFIAYSYIMFILNPNLCFILPYDLPALALMQLCIIAVLRRHWLLLMTAFAIATVNRETIFVVDIFLFVRWGLGAGRPADIKFAVILAAEWVAIKLGLSLALTGHHSGATIAQLTLGYNLTTILKIWQWPNIFALFVPVILSIWLLKSTNSREQRSWAITYLIGFSLIFLVANVTEHRAFGDLIGFAVVPIVFLVREKLDATAEDRILPPNAIP